MPAIFVDTWAWYALADRKDSDHSVAETANLQLLADEYTFVTTNFVLSESVTLIRYKMYHAAAVQFWETIHRLADSGLVDVIRVSASHEQRAWAIFEQYRDQDFSFTDCTSFAVMQDRQLSHAFTADHHFVTMGCIIVP